MLYALSVRKDLMISVRHLYLTGIMDTEQNMERLYNQSMKYHNFTDLDNLHFRMAVTLWAISCLAFPIICTAMYGLYRLIKSDHIAPVYVINLLMSDMLQICTKPVWHMISMLNIMHLVLFSVYSLGLFASICFMLLISAERYVMIACPIWYRQRHTKHMALWASFVVWVSAFIVMLIISLAIFSGFADEIILNSNIIAFYIFPYPLVIFFTMGTRKALSNSKSVPSYERRRIMGTLALVIFSYTVFYLPYIILMLAVTVSPTLVGETHFQNFSALVAVLLSLSPLVDPILYVFMRRDAKDIVAGISCCVGKDEKDSETLQAF